jgi:quercetin dioxygenase-like cupin family protein
MVDHYESIKERAVDGADGVYIRWLISPRTGAKNFAMRYFRIEPDGSSLLHSHPYEHEIFVLKGNGKLRLDKGVYEISQGSFCLIDSNLMHQFTNAGDTDLEFLCTIPIREDNIPAEEKKF